MLTAHLPSGYVLARSVRHRVPFLYPAALLGAVLPDFDMVFFLFVDEQSIHHHRYWVHIPAFWAAVFAVTVLPLHYAGYLRTGLVFYAAIFMHLLLDSINGGIMWLWPWSDRLLELVTVPAAYGHWVVSFLLHWTFLFEIVIWIVAIGLWGKARAAENLRPSMAPPET